jgi:hypothetical protein
VNCVNGMRFRSPAGPVDRAHGVRHPAIQRGARINAIPIRVKIFSGQ